MNGRRPLKHLHVEEEKDVREETTWLHLLRLIWRPLVGKMDANVAIAMSGLGSPMNVAPSYKAMSKEEAKAEAAHNMKESKL